MSRNKKRGRDLHGLLVLDKPIGLSSNRALQQVKRLFDAKKAGHTGTLDPLATGVLVICFGRATKIAQHVTDSNKIYQLKARLGEVTDTGDREGQVIATSLVTENHLRQLNKVIRNFEGAIKQTPPMYSAIKQNGVPLYKLARKGLEVERSSRDVNIDSITLDKVGTDWFECTVVCSKGTYIRTLVEDIGQQLGCGAHVQELRRTQVGEFGHRIEMISLNELEQWAGEDKVRLDRFLLPIEKAFLHYPRIGLKNGLLQLAERGATLKLESASNDEFFRIYDSDQMFRGIGQLDSGGCLHFQKFHR